MRKQIIAGNWKMNTDVNEAENLCKELIPLTKNVENVEIIICPPFTNLQTVNNTIKDSNIMLGAQNMNPNESGAFTGEISANMLKSIGCTHVIIGHSERRNIYNESDEFINSKVKSAIKNKLIPIVCVGETLEEREANKTKEIIGSQVEAALKEVEKNNDIIIAYEPVWAIGTGKTATPQMAQEIHAFIREILATIYDEESSQAIRILYGGSMKPANAKELLAEIDIDGGLIGGAALKAESFSEIIKR